MKVWYDACTGKHIRYGVAVARRLRADGHEVVFTTRRHPDTVKLAEYLGEKVYVVGKYSPSTKASKLKESLRRQSLLFRLFEGNPPDLAISHQSVELSRLAFGLGIPVISTHDSPHAEAVNRLTLPLTEVVVASKAIPPETLFKYGVKRVQSFDGVDEVSWIKGFHKAVSFDYPEPLIVVRQMETKAVYAEGKQDLTERIAKELTDLGTVVFLTRYERKERKNLIVPKGFVDSVSLAAQADLVVSVGGTIAREAALLGTPSIVVFPFGRSYVNDYLSKKGFPLYTVKVEEVLNHAKRLIGRKFDVKPLMRELEDPVDVIAKVVEEFER
ncbi:DUF354 domain-containing protein [Candidatus Bathyarchaeota archaeon]|nr:DUF354 domain-containing protein [Candidatus Bathyarchaeota archaeon]